MSENNSIDKKRILLPLPFPLAKLSAKILQLFPSPLLTEDQLRLLKYDNCESGIYKNNFDLGYNSSIIWANKWAEECQKALLPFKSSQK